MKRIAVGVAALALLCLPAAAFDPAHLEQLLATNACTDCDLSRAPLPAADLTGANLVRAYLATSNLNGATLTGADLTDAYVRSANLTDADLTDAVLVNAYFRHRDPNRRDACWSRSHRRRPSPGFAPRDRSH